MKHKIKFIGIVVAFLLMVTPLRLYAQENEQTNISFAGDSEEFIHLNDGNANTFMDMMPGEERTQAVTLTNNDYREMRFFVKAKDVPLFNKGEGSLVYDISFKNNKESFFNGKIGGKQKAGKENLSEEYLLKTLKKGESTTFEMSVKVDGNSMSNEFQGTLGNLGLVFSVEFDENNQVVEIIKKIPVINQIPGVQTGDTTMLNVILGVFVVSMGVIVFIIVKKRKDDKNEKA